MKHHLAVLRFLLLAVALGAAYVFWLNTGFNVPRALVQLRAASQVVIVLSFTFLCAAAPLVLPAQRKVVDAALASVVLFFIAVHSLPLVVRAATGGIAELVSRSGMSLPVLLAHHAFNMVLVPALLWLALSSVVCRVSNPAQRVNTWAYSAVIVLALAGLAYISLTPTWTIL
jgi:hypothetical protein